MRPAPRPATRPAAAAARLDTDPSRPCPAPAGNTSRAATASATNETAGNGPLHAAGDAPDSNGLSRSQNFVKVEAWLRDASRHALTDITPRAIASIDDAPPPPGSPHAAHADPPTERDRLPPMMPVAQSQLTLQS